jgi:glycosyltransferase involved in cell wall biosynthesis
MQVPSSRQPKLIAFYLPQFHPIPENDEWWGKGFTEWRNVTRAKPLYRGHYQPHLPADLGFYDLRVPEVREQQAALAKQYGIYGFCYYYYWFNGRKLLERPLEEVVALGKPDLPFCICWANENWSRRWDGSEHEILIAQEHTRETDEQFILDVLPILKDPRYIRVSGRPMLIVYRVDLLPRAVETASIWRSIAATNGIPDLHLCAVQSFGITDPRPFGFDAAVEFPPLGLMIGDVENQVTGVPLQFSGAILDYREAAKWALSTPVQDYPWHRGIMVAWDNSPRRGNRGYFFRHTSPDSYYNWLNALVRDSRTREGASEFIFINAWNEWAEGAHLEPDLKYGHGYLEATRRALVDPGSAEPVHVEESSRQDSPLVSVVIPSHNHARFIREAIASVERQTYANIELVVIDDGSTDDSASVIEETLSDSRFRQVIFRSQPNLGAAVAIDRGVMLSSGQYIAILNSDDVFAPERIETFVQRAVADRDTFLFSGVTFYCSLEDRIIENDGPDPRIRWYKDGLRLAAMTPTAGFALLGRSFAVSTSNFFFNRALFEKLLGFNNDLPRAHAWDFALRATSYVEPRFVPEELITYRYHRGNASGDLLQRDFLEGRAALARYLESVKDGTVNELAPSPANWPVFFDFFCSRVAPWFAPDPLSQYLPELERVRHVSLNERANGHLPHVRDDSAIRRFEAGLRNTWLSDAPVAALRTQIANDWASATMGNITIGISGAVQHIAGISGAVPVRSE